MSIEETQRVFEAFARASNEEWSDVDSMVSLFSEDGAAPFGGIDGLREFETSYRVAFPDWHREFTRVVIGDDGFAVVSRIRATNAGPYLGNPATNREIDIEGASFFRVVNGKISEALVVGMEAIGAKMAEQLGLGG